MGRGPAGATSGGEPSDHLRRTFVLTASIQRDRRKKFLRLKIRELQDLEDLVSQLEVWLSAKYGSQSLQTPLSPPGQELANILGILEDIEQLMSRKFPVQVLKWKKIANLRFRMEEAFARLLGEDQFNQSAPQLADVCLRRPSIDDLFPLDFISRPSLAKQRINAALQVSRILKEALTTVPIAGGALSATFGIATMILEKRKKLHHNHKVLLDIRLKFEMILQSLEMSGILIAITRNKDIILQNQVSPNIANKMKELSNFFARARHLALSAGSRNIEEETQLSNSVEQYRRDIVTLVSAENQIKIIRRTHQTYIAALTGLFFSLVSA